MPDPREIVKAKKSGRDICLAECIGKMRAHGIWISDRTVVQALQIVEEHPEC